MKTFRANVFSSTGSPVSGATITVTDHYSGLAITLYEEDETTLIASLSSDAAGSYSFKAEDGLFNIAISAPSYGISTTIEAVAHTDGGPLLTLTCAEATGIGYLKFAYISATNACKIAKKNGTEAEALADFICVTRGGRANGQVGAFRCPGGSFGGLTGGTAGATCYLGDAGGVTTTEPTGNDKVTVLGKFISATRLNYASVSPPFDPSAEPGLSVWNGPINVTGAFIKALPYNDNPGFDSPPPNNLVSFYSIVVPSGFQISRWVVDAVTALSGTGGLTNLNMSIGAGLSGTPTLYPTGSNTYSGVTTTDIIATTAGARILTTTASAPDATNLPNSGQNWWLYFQGSAPIGNLNNGGLYKIWYELVRLPA